MAMLDIGSTKQLFIDDYIIESLTNAKQGLNPAVKVDHNPILRQERPWEGNVLDAGKVLFDEQDVAAGLRVELAEAVKHLEELASKGAIRTTKRDGRRYYEVAGRG